MGADIALDNDPRMSVSRLRTVLQIARIFVEGKALVPDATVLMSIDIVLKETKRHDLLSNGGDPG